MINLDMLPQENSFKAPEPGFYFAKISAASMKTPKPDKDGHIGKDYLSVTFDLLDRSTMSKKVGTVFDSMYDSEAQLLLYKLGRFIKACGIPLAGQVELKDLGKLVVGKTIGIDVKNEEYQGRINAKVDITSNEAYYTVEALQEVLAKLGEQTVQDNSFMNVPETGADAAPFNEEAKTAQAGATESTPSSY